MAYVFDPINNTLIDDEDKSLGNKLGLMDDGRVNFGKGTKPAYDYTSFDHKINELKAHFKRYQKMGGTLSFDIFSEAFAKKNFAEGGAIGKLTRSEAKSFKFKNPDLFNKIIELAETKELGPTAIARHPDVIKLNKGKEISYGSMERIITNEKGKSFFKDLTKQKSYFVGNIRKTALANIDNILEDYYKGIGTRELTKKYFPNSKEAKTGRSATSLERVIDEKADPVRLKNRPNFVATGKGVSPAQIILNNPKAKAEFIKFSNLPENRILDSMEEAGKIAKKYAPEGIKISGYSSRTGFMDSGLRDLITKEVEFSNPFKGRGEGSRVSTEVEKTRGKRIAKTAPVDIEGTKKFQFHHIMNIGGEIPLDLNDVAIINAKMNRTLSSYNTRLNNIADSITSLISEQPKGYLKKIDRLNDAGEKVVKNAIKELPNEYKKLIGFNRVVPVLDEYGTPINFVGKKFGGSGKTNPALKLEKLTIEQKSNLKKQVKADAKALERGRLKDKVLSTTGKVLKGVGKVIKPVGYAVGTKALFDARAMAADQGIELSTADQFMALDSGDPNVAINNYMRRNDPEFAAAERAKDLAQMEDDFEEVGLDEIQPDETLKSFMANGGRVGFSNGGAAGANENFATELEYFLTNEDAELPQLSTYSEPNNPIQIINDIIDPRNYPYYADVLARSGIRIGEFATRILPATGKLINDLITKPAFKIERPSEGVSKKSDYVQEYTDILPSNIKGTGIFSEYLENITPTATEKFIGLDKLIEKEEQKQKDRGSTVGPKVFADTVGLGAEVTAPIFPGLKVAQKVLKPKKIAAAVENRKTDAPEIPNKIPELDSIENLELNLAILRNRAKNPDAPVEEVTRVLVRKLLDKKGIQYGNNDPVDVYMDIYGDIILDVKNLAEEIVDGIQAGRNFKSIDDLLRIEGLDDIPIPKEPNQGVPTEDVIEMLEKDLREKKMLEGFNTTDKTKNAKGGIIK